MPIPNRGQEVSKVPQFRHTIVFRVIISLVILTLSTIICIIGFYRSMPILMVIGLLFIGLVLIDAFKRFNLKLIAILLTFTYVPAVALLWPLVHHFHFQIIDNSIYRLESLAFTKATYIDEWLNQRDNDLLFLEENIKTLNYGMSSESGIQDNQLYIRKTGELLDKFTKSSPIYRDVFIMDMNGQAVLSSDNTAEPGDYSMLVQNSNLSRELIVSEVFLDSRQPVITVFKTIEFAGAEHIAGIKCNLLGLEDVINPVTGTDRPEDTLKISLVDENGYYTITSDKENIQPLKSKIHKNFSKYLQQIGNMDLYYYNDKGLKTVGAYSKVNKTGWYVISEQSFREIIYNVDKNLMDVFIIMIVNFAAVLIFAPVFSKGITGPILKIRDMAIEGASGKLEVHHEEKRRNMFEYREADDTMKAFKKMIITLGELKESLESKVEEKTRMAAQLKESNEELNAQQEELTYLNEALSKTNDDLKAAYNDLQKTQTKLIQNEKMASLGMLVAGVAHEINSPLGAINSNIGNYESIIRKLESKAGNDDEINKITQDLKTLNNMNTLACDRIIKIVRSLKSFARLDEAEYKQADLHEGIDNTIILLNHRIKDKIKIIKGYGDLPRVNCYAEQLNQVFMNLLINAIESIQTEGTIHIKTYHEDKKIYIKIKDNGVGIKKEHIDRIFDPGFTTKGVGVGTGLGLSIVYNIIENHKGNILVESQEGLGTEFTIELPLQQ